MTTKPLPPPPKWVQPVPRRVAPPVKKKPPSVGHALASGFKGGGSSKNRVRKSNEDGGWLEEAVRALKHGPKDDAPRAEKISSSRVARDTAQVRALVDPKGGELRHYSLEEVRRLLEPFFPHFTRSYF